MKLSLPHWVKKVSLKLSSELGNSRWSYLGLKFESQYKGGLRRQWTSSSFTLRRTQNVRKAYKLRLSYLSVISIDVFFR